MVLMTPQLEKIACNAARTTGNPVYPHGGSSCDKFCDWWINLSALNMIGLCNCVISGSEYSQLSDFTVPFQP